MAKKTSLSPVGSVCKVDSLELFFIVTACFFKKVICNQLRLGYAVFFRREIILMSTNPAVLNTQRWVHEFIIGHNICPFAKKEVEKGSIHYEVYDGRQMEDALCCLMDLCRKLDEDDEIEAAMFIAPNGFSEFEEYLDLLDVANGLLVQQDYEGIYQLASFHPDYCFEGVDKADASHYTNRSPYPMLHIIREEGLEKVLERYPNPEAIPERNITYCQELGVDTLKEILKNCRKPGD
ncbi:MAG: DUF1415 domain-containing protein [Pseudomonadales bacterium]|nr:DUF1415 domain-containing protein [Pseudomonadales bacterium]